MYTDMQDFVGQSIQLDDHVVYTSRQGSSLYLTHGIVQDFGTTQDNWFKRKIPYIIVEPIQKSFGWQVGRPVRLSHPEYIVVLKCWNEPPTL